MPSLPTTYVARSSIHGRGLFAARRLRRGMRIGSLVGTRTTRDGPHVLWIEEEDGSIWGLRGENDIRFTNHASDPNAHFDGVDLIALRTIQPDEEITADYGW